MKLSFKKKYHPQNFGWGTHKFGDQLIYAHVAITAMSNKKDRRKNLYKFRSQWKDKPEKAYTMAELRTMGVI